MDKGVLDFGQALLEKGDLDPVYNFLAESATLTNRETDDDQFLRWVHSYSMFYHVGVANYMVDLPYYWPWVKANLSTLPRGEERRHFRGSAANRAVEIMSRYTPEWIVSSWYSDLEFSKVRKAVKTWYLYGDWIAFKLADIGERVLGYDVDFSDCVLGIYSEPRAGAAIVLGQDTVTDEDVNQVVNYITTELNAKGFLAPPWNDRPLNIQEAETILCKYKSHLHGHYPVGKDIEAVNKAMKWLP